MTELIRYERALQALTDAKGVDEVKGVRDKAVAMQLYARQAKDKQLIEYATDIRLRAEIRAGEMLQKMGDDDERPRGRKKESHVATLSTLGVTKTQSSRWQRLASLAPEVQEEVIARVTKKAVLSVDGASKRTRQEMRTDDEARVLALTPIVGKFKTIVIDPPWDYEWLSIAGRASPGYACMTHDQLLALDVAQWADDDCHLYCWTTNNFMPRAVELVARWGFQHKTILTWVKPRWGLGSYFRNSTEHVLFAVRGELRTRSDSIATHFEAPLGEHSEKPERFYEIVREASYGPVAEIFQREPRPDFRNVYGVLPTSEAAE